MSAPLTQKLTPINVEAEKQKFLFDQEYNPQFEYAEEFEAEDLLQHGQASDEYIATARFILSKVLKNWPDDETYIQETEGEVLSQSEVEKGIQEYLKAHHLEDIVTTTFTNKAVARTSVKGNNLIVRLPVHYRTEGLRGMLEHEIGVHVLRRLNDEQQPWRGSRTQFQLGSYLGTEEGLAVLHSNAIRSDKHLWFAALSYFAVYMAQRLSFAQLAKELQPYVSSKEKLWSICLKTKRGLQDTSLPGGFTKNQVYLAGTIEVLRWLKENDFDATPLYIGKVSLQDLPLATQHSALTLAQVRTPNILQDRKWYKEQLLTIARENKLPL